MNDTNNIDPKRLAEVKAAAAAIVPRANKDEMAAALLVMVFDPTIREHIRNTQRSLWVQILHALGPITGPEAASIDSASL